MTQQHSVEQALDALAVGQDVTVVVERCAFEIARTSEHGVHTGRPRFSVQCLTCRELIHEATTGPWCRVEQHLRQVSAGRS